VPTASVNGTSIFYRQSGRGPDVVLIHGLAGDHAYWYLRLLPLLVPDFRVTVYDLRGHGLSAVPRTGYSSAVMAADLAGLLERLRTEGAHVVGHSFGGLVALQLARTQPAFVRSLTIADTRIDALQPVRPASTWAGWPEWQARLGAVGVHVDGDPELDFQLLDKVADLPREATGGTGGPRLFGRRSRQRWQRLLATTNAPTELPAAAGVTRRALRSIGQPAQLLYGERSFCLPTAHELLRLLPRSHLVVLPGVGHFHPITDPQTLARQLRSFLQGRGD
jgi:pimeloyl-ACP methyl ester carboxylesterase